MGRAAVQNPTLSIRTSVDNPQQLAGAITQVIHEVDKDLPVVDVNSFTQVLSHEISPRRFSTGLLSLFAAIALALAAIGVYGVTAYTVAQRTQEVGIRMAIGAQTTDVMKLFLRDALKLVLLGLALGIAGAFALTRLMQSLLFGVSATDAMTFLLVAVGLFVVALVACYIPARRATKVDPLVALRYE